MMTQKMHQVSSWMPPSQEAGSQMASRPFAPIAPDQPQKSVNPIAHDFTHVRVFAPGSPMVMPVQPKLATPLHRSFLDHPQSEVPQPNKTGLPDRLKTGIERLSGYSMDDVRVHYNSAKPAQLQAHAYAQGTEIHLASGQEKHLPHEAWHVVQQKQGRVTPTIQMKGLQINDDEGLEKEADVMGASALQVLETDPMQSSDRTGAHPTARLAMPIVQSRGVMQLSTDESQSTHMAAVDRQMAVMKMEKSQLKITAIRSGEQLMDEGMDEDLFSGLPQTTGHTAVTRRSVSFNVNRGNGWETYRIPVQDLMNYVRTCQQNGWQCNVPSLPREYALTENGEIIQRAATASGYGGGHMNENAAATVIGVAAPNLVNGNLTFSGVTARNTSTGASGTSLNRQPNGAPVGGTRPNQWTDFVAMIGAINPFKQGHMISERLGGDGQHDNLTPFTPSINALHYSRVESHVISQTDNPPNRDQYADYSVTPRYNGNAGIVNWAHLQFAGMTPDNQRTAMVTAGAMTAVAAAAYLPGSVLSVGDLATANLWLTNYINAAFPTDIVCWAEFINDVGGTYDSTPRQTVTITNDF